MAAQYQQPKAQIHQRQPTRRPTCWLIVGIWVLIVVTLQVLGSSNPMITVVFACLIPALDLIVLLRFGLVAFAIKMFVILLLQSFPITTDFSAWYGGSSLFTLLAVLALAGYTFALRWAGGTCSRGAAGRVSASIHP